MIHKTTKFLWCCCSNCVASSYIAHQIHPRSLTASPWNVTLPKEKDRLPSIIFQLRAAKLRGNIFWGKPRESFSKTIILPTQTMHCYCYSREIPQNYHRFVICIVWFPKKKMIFMEPLFFCSLQESKVIAHIKGIWGKSSTQKCL